MLSLWKQKMAWGEKLPPKPQYQHPPHTQAPLSAPRMERNLPGDLLALSGAEEGRKLILTSWGFFLAFMFLRPGVGHQVPPESTELGEELKKVVILLPPDRTCQSPEGRGDRKVRVLECSPSPLPRKTPAYSSPPDPRKVSPTELGG